MRNNVGHCGRAFPRSADTRGAGILPASQESFIKPRAGCPRYARAGCPRHVWNRHEGFTLVELLVAVVIMVLMMLAFGMIVTQAQKTVAGSQAITQSNRTAEAIARAIRNDLAQITKNGFLCITRYDGEGSASRPYLLFTTAGSRQSRTGTYRTLDGLSVYGWATPQTSTGANVNYRILFYQGWLLWRNAGSGNEYDLLAPDVLDTNLAKIQTKSRVDINTFINQIGTHRIPPDSPNSGAIVYPPDTYDQITNFAWQILSPEVNSLGIQWTDGSIHSTNGTLNWFGVNSDSDADGKDSITGDPSDEWSDADPPKTVADTEWSESIHGYRALWTLHDQNNWPTAIRISFQIFDPTLSEDVRTESYMVGGEERHYTRYEVIVPIH